MSPKQLIRDAADLLFTPVVWTYRFLEKLGLVSFAGASQVLALAPGRFGQGLRALFYSGVLDTVSRKCVIDFGTLLSNKDVAIEDNVYIGAYCIIGGCSIGRDTLVGSFVDIMPGPQSHGTQCPDTPIRLQPGTYERVRIGRDCWIGNKSVVMRSIGDHSVIGAGSIVTRIVAPRSMAAGNPARILKQRDVPQTERSI